MINFYCWFQNLSKDEYSKIIKKSVICTENNCKYSENDYELCIVLNENKLINKHTDDIFKDLEDIIERKLDCHINVCDDFNNQFSIVQKNGFRTVDYQPLSN